MVTKKILLVDDEPNLLAVLQRTLSKQFNVETACGPVEGLAKLTNWQEFAVIVSDMRMPEMTGVEFLTRVKEFAPDIVRIMLTGNADQDTAIKAVNQGSIFRFLTKPCSAEDLIDTLTAGVRQHQLITAEHDLLENTLRGSIKILTEILALADPTAFGHAEKVRDQMRQLCAVMQVKDSWEFEAAALLSYIGFVTIPAELILKFRASQPLTVQEQDMFRNIPAISGRLLSQISRLEGVSKTLAYQGKHFDGSGLPNDAVAGAAIPLGARMLKFLYDLVELEGKGHDQDAALAQMRARTGWYDPQILETFKSGAQSVPPPQAAPPQPPLAITFSQLRVGHVLRADIHTRDGVLIVVTGNRISSTLIERLRNFESLSGIKEPIFVDG